LALLVLILSAIAVRTVTAEAWIRRSVRLLRTTDYATVMLPLPVISNDLEVVRLL